MTNKPLQPEPSPTPSPQPSLRRRLLLSLLLPGVILAVTLGAAGSVLISDIVTTTHDRLLEGALLAVIERVGVEEGEVTVDIPLAALGMLESGSQDNIYYGVLYDGGVVTGYGDLPLSQKLQQAQHHTVYWDGDYKGSAIRLAGQMVWVYGKPEPVLTIIAETISGRQALQHRMLLALALLESVLLAVLGASAWVAVDRGLRPLTNLSNDLNARGVRGALSFAPLNLRTIPREALAPAQAFNALLRRLEAAVGTIQRFTADASHQLRTPLAVMQMQVTLARRNLARPAMVEVAVDEIDGAVRRLDHLVGQLISLARADETENRGETAHCDLGQVVAELIADRFPDALAAGIDMQVERPDGAIAVHGSEVLVRELTANLLDNAVRYNQSGGTVEVHITPDTSVTTMRIEDNGPGIPIAERGHVFERFYRIPRSQAPQGSGLGLAIVRASCERIGATITLDDRTQGPGLAVLVTFRTAA